jgi:hypothetical protein
MVVSLVYSNYLSNYLFLSNYTYYYSNYCWEKKFYFK